MSLRDFFLLCGFSVGIILVGGVILIILFRRKKNRATAAPLSMENQSSGSGQGANGQASGHSNGQESVQMGNGYYLGAVPKTRSFEPKVKYHAGAESVSMTLGDYQQDHYKKLAGNLLGAFLLLHSERKAVPFFQMKLWKKGEKWKWHWPKLR